MRTFDKYKQNLRATDNHVYSYETKVAEIDHATSKQLNRLDGGL